MAAVTDVIETERQSSWTLIIVVVLSYSADCSSEHGPELDEVYGPGSRSSREQGFD